MADQRLSSLDIRVLMAISFHDRFSKNGVGCTAGHGRLASLVGCHLKSLSRSIKTLAECGYVGGRANPLNPKSRCYFVIYNSTDEAIMKTVKGNQPVTYTGNEAATYSAPIGNQFVPESGGIGNRLSEIAEQHQSDAPYNILGEALINPVETVLIDPVETASSTLEPCKRGKERVNSTSVGAMLAMAERSMKNGAEKARLNYWFDWLDGLVGNTASLTNDDANYGRARRLFEEIGSVLDVGGA
ncbi:helix-turn-helix domain-containing protein [Mesorhizobium mediterraneum]|nr:hypothetical protein [Mesorhizobium mediterraneum]WIW51134.1 helix-turn-helix domain-containing protein [Mesorhizobium mediterraneum]